jgi:3',5'-cyclic AMP phosphodiesterase CpdA
MAPRPSRAESKTRTSCGTKGGKQHDCGRPEAQAPKLVRVEPAPADRDGALAQAPSDLSGEETAWYTNQVRRASLLLGLVLCLPAAGHAGGPPPVRLIAFGDFGVGGSTQRAFGVAVRRFEARNPADYLVTLGDNDDTESPADFRANWEESFGWAEADGLRVAGVLGNHDIAVQRGRYQYETLNMPRRYYRRAVGGVELYLLDSNRVDAAQTRWLRRALAGSRARWRIAVFHHPPFTCGQHTPHAHVLGRWVPLFERYRVRLVLSGHDHNYQRFAPRRGVRYVVHGGGNPHNLYGLGRCRRGHPRQRAARVEHGFLYLVVRGARLDGYAVTPTGRRTDHFAFRG